MSVPTDVVARPVGPGVFTPVPYRVVGRREESADVVTLSIEPVDGPPLRFRHGQFNMLTSFGQGEIAISVSSAPGARGPIEHSVRDVGAVSDALCRTPVGSVVGVRGPFGSSWGVDELDDGVDAVVMAGGIGLAPLRGAVRDLVARQEAGRGSVFVLVGARAARPDPVRAGPRRLATRWHRTSASPSTSGPRAGMASSVSSPRCCRRRPSMPRSRSRSCAVRRS